MEEYDSINNDVENPELQSFFGEVTNVENVFSKSRSNFTNRNNDNIESNEIAEIKKAFNDGCKAINERTKELKISNEEALNVLIGDTGAGKSTLTGYLCNIPQEGRYYPNTREYAIAYTGNQPDAPQVRRGASLTTVPNFIRDDKGNIYCDCPGFGANTTVKRNIIDAMFIQHVLSSKNKFKFIALISYDGIRDPRYKPLIALMRDLVELFDNIESVQNLITLIATNVSSVDRNDVSDEDVVLNILTKSLEEKDAEGNYLFNGKCRDLLSSIYNKKNVCTFGSPVRCEHPDLKKDSNNENYEIAVLDASFRPKIQDKLNKVPTIDKVSVKIPITPESKNRAKSIAESYMKKIAHIHSKIVLKVMDSLSDKVDEVKRINQTRSYKPILSILKGVFVPISERVNEMIQFASEKDDASIYMSERNTFNSDSLERLCQFYGRDISQITDLDSRNLIDEVHLVMKDCEMCLNLIPTEKMKLPFKDIKNDLEILKKSIDDQNKILVGILSKCIKLEIRKFLERIANQIEKTLSDCEKEGNFEKIEKVYKILKSGIIININMSQGQVERPKFDAIIFCLNSSEEINVDKNDVEKLKEHVNNLFSLQNMDGSTLYDYSSLGDVFGSLIEKMETFIESKINSYIGAVSTTMRDLSNRLRDYCKNVKEFFDVSTNLEQLHIVLNDFREFHSYFSNMKIESIQKEYERKKNMGSAAWKEMVQGIDTKEMNNDHVNSIGVAVRIIKDIGCDETMNLYMEIDDSIDKIKESLNNAYKFAMNIKMNLPEIHYSDIDNKLDLISNQVVNGVYVTYENICKKYLVELISSIEKDMNDLSELIIGSEDHIKRGYENLIYVDSAPDHLYYEFIKSIIGITNKKPVWDWDIRENKLFTSIINEKDVLEEDAIKKASDYFDMVRKNYKLVKANLNIFDKEKNDRTPFSKLIEDSNSSLSTIAKNFWKKLEEKKEQVKKSKEKAIIIQLSDITNNLKKDMEDFSSMVLLGTYKNGKVEDGVDSHNTWKAVSAMLNVYIALKYIDKNFKEKLAYKNIDEIVNAEFSEGLSLKNVTEIEHLYRVKEYYKLYTYLIDNNNVPDPQEGGLSKKVSEFDNNLVLWSSDFWKSLSSSITFLEGNLVKKVSSLLGNYGGFLQNNINAIRDGITQIKVTKNSYKSLIELHDILKKVPSDFSICKGSQKMYDDIKSTKYLLNSFHEKNFIELTEVYDTFDLIRRNRDLMELELVKERVESLSKSMGGIDASFVKLVSTEKKIIERTVCEHLKDEMNNYLNAIKMASNGIWASLDQLLEVNDDKGDILLCLKKLNEKRKEYHLLTDINVICSIVIDGIRVDEILNEISCESIRSNYTNYEQMKKELDFFMNENSISMARNDGFSSKIDEINENFWKTLAEKIRYLQGSLKNDDEKLFLEVKPSIKDGWKNIVRSGDNFNVRDRVDMIKAINEFVEQYKGKFIYDLDPNEFKNSSIIDERYFSKLVNEYKKYREIKKRDYISTRKINDFEEEMRNLERDFWESIERKKASLQLIAYKDMLLESIRSLENAHSEVSVERNNDYYLALYQYRNSKLWDKNIKDRIVQLYSDAYRGVMVEELSEISLSDSAINSIDKFAKIDQIYRDYDDAKRECERVGETRVKKSCEEDLTKRNKEFWKNFSHRIAQIRNQSWWEKCCALI